MTETPQRLGVAAVERALSIVAAFDDQSSALSLADLARRTGLYKSTILRLCVSLERFGYLRRGSDGYYRLGPSLFELGQRYQQNFQLETYVMPVLEQLVAATGESASLYVQEGDKRVCLFRVNSTAHRVLHYVQVGTQLPLETGAAGKLICAFSHKKPQDQPMRDALLVISKDNRVSDTAAIAAPVFNSQGFLGALSLAGPRSRFDDAKVNAMCLHILQACIALSRAIGGEEQALYHRYQQMLEATPDAPEAFAVALAEESLDE